MSEPDGHRQPSPDAARNCATCNGWVWIQLGRWVRRRETRGMVRPSCGWDYARGEPDGAA